MTILENERPPKPLTNVVLFAKDFTVHQATVGFVGFLFAVTGPTAIMLSVGLRAGIPEVEIASWLFGAFFLNGLISFFMCWIYRQPLIFLWSISGMVLVGPALEHLNFGEILGAYYVAGLMMVILGLSGWVRRIMDSIPLHTVMGMVAGVFLQFGLDWVNAFLIGPHIAIPMTAAFFAVAAIPVLANRVPPLIMAIAAGLLAMTIVDESPDIEKVSLLTAIPIVYAPTFSWSAMFELVVPLMITVLAAQNSQGISVLRTADHKPPIDLITTTCGFGSIITAITGTVSTCLTGPTSAILVSGGTERSGHYTAAIFACIGIMAFGVFSPLFISLMLATPKAFIATLAGIAILSVLKNSFTTAFGGKFPQGALIAFITTVSNFTLLNIGAPFWGLLFGFLVSWIIERDKFFTSKAER